MLNTDRLCLGCMNDCGGEKVCPICGYDSTMRNPSDCLPAKIWLSDRYLVGRVVSRSKGCISYIGWDNVDDSIVTVREYFPAGLAHRNPDKTVSVDEEGKYVYNGGLLSFIDTNKKLMQSGLPSVMQCNEVFEENGTAYVINASFNGIVLSDFLNRNGGILKWEQARPLFMPLMDTLKAMHEMGIIHGNISPETVLVGRDGKLRLSNICLSADNAFGISEHINDGFSAIEQYDTDKYSVSPATDVYSLSATLVNVLIGTVPPAANLRLENDSLSVPSKFAEELPRNVLVALANGLQVLPEKRTADIEGFRNELVYSTTSDGSDISIAAPKKSETQETDGKASKNKGNKSSGVKSAAIAAACTVLIFLIMGAMLCLTVFRERIFGNNKNTQSNPSDTVVSEPSSQVLGSTGEAEEPEPKKYAVPSFVGKWYSAVVEDAQKEYENFVIIIKDKAYSDDYPRGIVCEQSIKEGTGVVKGTEIELTVSAGPLEIGIKKVIGLTKDQAILELLKQGFIYENIKIEEKYDEDAKPGIVLDQSPKFGTKANTDIAVEIFINAYEGEEPEQTDDDSYQYN